MAGTPHRRRLPGPVVLARRGPRHRADGPGADQLAGWPAGMRVFARRERPHPGAQLTLFETHDGWRYSLWVTNLPTSPQGWRAKRSLTCTPTWPNPLNS
ncbi:MAG: hypothetical protein ACRDQU_13470 [Pseudonocardiaceae bacterium]